MVVNERDLNDALNALRMAEDVILKTYADALAHGTGDCKYDQLAVLQRAAARIVAERETTFGSLAIMAVKEALNKAAVMRLARHMQGG